MPTVLIADDSPTLRRIVSSVLERAGYTVVIAEDGVEAVQGAFRSQPDAIILDVQMPRLSGYVAARLLKDDWQTAEIPVVLLTSLDAASDRYWGAQTGADRFLTKDFEAPRARRGRRRGHRPRRRGPRRPAAAAPGPGRAGRRRGAGPGLRAAGPQAVRGLGRRRGHPDRRRRARLRGDRRRGPRRARPDRRLRPGRRLHARRPADLPHGRARAARSSSTASSSAPSPTRPPR